MKSLLSILSRKLFQLEPQVRHGAQHNTLLWYDYISLDKKVREESAFLDPDMTLEKLGMVVGHNRTRVSQIVNGCAHMNFNDYLNWYRVQYMIHLIARDPRQKLEDISKKAGFNSQPTYNSAFRKFVDMKPGEIVRYHLSKGRNLRPSRLVEPELIPPHELFARGERILCVSRGAKYLHLG